MTNSVLSAAPAILTLLACPSPAAGQTLEKLQLHKVRATTTDYRGIKAVHLTQIPDAQGEDTLAIVTGPELQDGTIEVELAGAPAPGAVADARGFIGVAFRVKPNAAKFELLYLAPYQRTGGRPGSPEPLYPIHLFSGLALVPHAEGNTRAL